MTEQTRCPACGAPLTFVGEQDVVVCDFCNTQIRVLHEGDEERYEVVSKPQPEKQAFTQPVESEVEEVLFGASAPEEEPVIAAGETSTPFEASGSGDTFFAPPPPVSPPPFSGTTGGAQVFAPPSSTTDTAARPGGLPRWAIITIIVVAVLCLAGICGVAALIGLFANLGVGY